MKRSEFFKRAAGVVGGAVMSGVAASAVPAEQPLPKEPEEPKCGQCGHEGLYLQTGYRFETEREYPPVGKFTAYTTHTCPRCGWKSNQ